MTDALIVFAKLPVPGRVKTRLLPALTGAEAARLYEAFLRDALALYATLGPDVRLYLSPPAEPRPPDLLPAGAEVFVQKGRGLGARMLHAALETFAAGYERIVLIGTDHPTLPPAFIQLAFDALQRPLSVSIGPSDDGGYYLLGMNELYPALFEGMTYSHPGVFAQTLERVARTDARLTVLPPWYDVDTPASLRRLVQELPSSGLALDHTRRTVAALQAAHPFLAR